MAVIVQKYGGSSVADVQRIGQVADRVMLARREGHQVVVVVSAMGKTTDELLRLARSVAAAAPDAPQDPPRRKLDMLLSTGERVTMALLSIALHARGADAISFTGSQSGILTNDRHFDARILEVRPHRIEDELARGRIVIVAGYQGMSYRREITTLGRGGSDTTAVALAAALGAERCEIYSDVDGVYTADPRVVAGARHLPAMDYASLQEMAEAGARVLNAQAVEWARRAGIVLHARRTTDVRSGSHGGGSDGGGAGEPRETVVRGAAPAVPVRAVVGLADVALATLPAAAFGAFATEASELGLPLLDAAVAGPAASAVIPLANVPDWRRCKGHLARDLGAGGLQLAEGLALLSVVGDGLTTVARGVPRLLVALAGASIPVRALAAGPLRVGVVVDGEHLAEGQRVLHRCFVDEA